jgi:hypothetical protein
MTFSSRNLSAHSLGWLIRDKRIAIQREDAEDPPRRAKIWILSSTLTAFTFSFSPFVCRFPRLSEITSLRSG